MRHVAWIMAIVIAPKTADWTNWETEFVISTAITKIVERMEAIVIVPQDVTLPYLLTVSVTHRASPRPASTTMVTVTAPTTVF